MTFSEKELLEIFDLPREAYWRELAPKARECCVKANGEAIKVSALLGYSNICKNHCLYCGMRADNTCLRRYRMTKEDMIAAGTASADAGFGRLFLVSGEDPLFPFADLLEIVSCLHRRGVFLSLACGEFSPEQYRELKAAGADEYVVKFEMSDPKSFDRLNPSTTFKKRMAAIDAVKQSGMQLASGNIIGWPGQTREELAQDILLMKRLEISWAPVIPYLPAKGTPLAQEDGAADRWLMLKELSVLRLMMPQIRITAQQPGDDLSRGLADLDGNLDAVKAGGNVLFFDLMPSPDAQVFRVIDNRNITGTSHIFALSEKSGLPLDTAAERVKE